MLISAILMFVCQTVDVPVYSDLDYQLHLHDENWTKQETDQLFDLCHRFDLRFVVIHDRWDHSKSKRSIEDLKERYYGICNTLAKVCNASTVDNLTCLSRILLTEFVAIRCCFLRAFRVFMCLEICSKVCFLT